MRYQLKEKVWSWTDTYRILDETEHEALSVHGKFFSWGKDNRFGSTGATLIS